MSETANHRHLEVTEALRHLDAELAVRLFGSPVERALMGEWWQYGIDGLEPVPRYSSTWDGAGAVVEAMRERGYCIELHDNVISFEAVFLPHASRTDLAMAEGHADTATLAIARAALEALEAEARVRELEGRP